MVSHRQNFVLTNFIAIQMQRQEHYLLLFTIYYS